MPFIVSPTQGGVDVLSVPGGYSILWDSGAGITEAVPGEQGPMATVKYRLYDSNDRYSFAQQLLGQWQGSPPSSLSYVGPYVYPPSPNLICTSITEIKAWSKPRFLPVGRPYLFGSQAVVTAVFTRPTWQAASNGGYFTITFAGNGETLAIPETSMFFADGTPTFTPVTIQCMGAEISVTRYRMPFLPDNISIPMTGLVNGTPFQIGNNVYGAGTLLFSPGNSTTQSDPLGNITYQFEYKFLYKAQGWNNALHPASGTFQPIANGAGTPPYLPGNFDQLP